jgi:orotate phosphoribosyltransferase-like protein
MDEIDKLHVRMQGFTKEKVAEQAKVGRDTLGYILARKQTNFRQGTLRAINKALDDLGAKQI